MSSLKKFLSNIESIDFNEPGVIICTGSSYPLLFFSQLILRLKKNIPIQSIEVSANYQSLIANLQTSFLGKSQLFFLNNLSSLSGRSKKDLFSFLATYQGPHILIVYCDKKDFLVEDWSKARHLDLLSEVDRVDYKQLISYLFFGIKTSKKFEERLFFNHKSIPLDTACLLSYYNITLGKSVDQFFSGWAESILGSKKSLFTLSQYFFSKNPQNFLLMWKKISQEFPPEFWIAYWSEQLWQAKIFLHYASQSRAVEGRRYASRLPFSFFQRDWRKCKESELVLAHNFLYSLDYNMKNGSCDTNFELFYFKFLTNKFV